MHQTGGSATPVYALELRTVSLLIGNYPLINLITFILCSHSTILWNNLGKWSRVNLTTSRNGEKMKDDKRNRIITLLLIIALIGLTIWLWKTSLFKVNQKGLVLDIVGVLLVAYFGFPQTFIERRRVCWDWKGREKVLVMLGSWSGILCIIFGFVCQIFGNK